jgi:cytochrome c peroxidase
VADDPVAARMGQALFFDRGMSADGRVSCASCHAPGNGFADPRPLSLGVQGRVGTRHAPTLLNASGQDFFFWGGRADSLWSAPMQAIEAELEADFTRVEVAHHVAARYRAPYEDLFGPLPDLSGLPARAKPGDAAWEQMTAQQQEQVNRVFSNVGKVLEAYQRELTCQDTRFDRVIAGLEEFTPQEQRGARQFTDPNGGNCVACHGGINFSDGRFHNLQIPGSPEDLGRAEGVPSLLANPFNGAGDFSDDTGAGQEKLDGLAGEPPGVGAFKTPTLRGVTQRAPYGHLGHIGDLEQWLVEVYLRPRPSDAPGQRDPEARGLRFNARDMAAFLRTLECPDLPQELVQPIGPDGQAVPVPVGAPAQGAAQGPGGQQPPPGGRG